MGEAKRRRDRGLPPRGNAPWAPLTRGAVTFEDARGLIEDNGQRFWTWVPRYDGDAIAGAYTYVAYKDDDDEGDGRAWVIISGDWWDTPEIGEEGDAEMVDIADGVGDAAWYPVPAGLGFGLSDFSFYRLRELGCAHPAVLAVAREYDAHLGHGEDV